MSENRELLVHRVGHDWGGTRRLIDEGAPVVSDANSLLATIGLDSGVICPQHDAARPIEEEKLALFGPLFGGGDTGELREQLVLYVEGGEN